MQYIKINICHFSLLLPPAFTASLNLLKATHHIDLPSNKLTHRAVNKKRIVDQCSFSSNSGALFMQENI